jgi:hypothetical protein
MDYLFSKKQDTLGRYYFDIEVSKPFNKIGLISGENWTSDFAQEIIEDIYKVIRGELEETEISDNHGAIICLEVHKVETDVIALSMRGEEFLYSIPTSEILKLMEDFRNFLISQGV